MRDTEIREAQSLSRIDAFGTERAVDFPAASLGGQKFAAVKALVAELDQLGEDQASAKGAAQASAEAKRVGRTSVRRKMRAMRETAKAMDADLPGFSDKFRLPTANGEEVLINAARAFVTDSTPFKSQFVQHEMPNSFIEDLSAANDTFENAANDQNVQTAKRVATTAGIKNALSRGKKLRRELNSIVSNKYRDDPASLAAWKSASHVEHQPKKKKNETPLPPK